MLRLGTKNYAFQGNAFRVQSKTIESVNPYFSSKDIDYICETIA